MYADARRMFGTRSFVPPWCLIGFVLLLAACPTVDLGDTPADPGVCRPDPGVYRDVIWPEVLAPADTSRSCVAQSGCHAVENGRSALRLEIPADENDFATHDRNYDVVTRFLNCGTPDASSLVTKPLAGVDPHGGGDIFPNGSDPAVDAVVMWLQ